MSYCRFENTYADLLDCADAMRNIEESLSRSEARSFAELVELCKVIAERFEDVDYHELIEMSKEK
jgi:hypothetical protein